MNVNPTRMELIKLKKKLKTAHRGHKLLKEKRDGLMKYFLSIIKEAKALRLETDSFLSETMRELLLISSLKSVDFLQESLSNPTDQVSLVAETKNVMSVQVPLFKAQITPGDLSYSLLSTPANLDPILKQFQQILPQLVKLAETEHSAKLLALEIEKTRRRVNALEHVLIPQMKATIKLITAKLAEQERSALVTLMKVRDALEMETAS